MSFDYAFIVKNNTAKYTNAFSFAVTGISALLFLVQLLAGQHRQPIFLLSFVVLAAGLTLNLYLSVKKRMPAPYSPVLAVAGITWFAMPFFTWIGVPLLALALLEKRARLPLRILFFKDRITLNTLLTKNFYWKDLDNTVLKDGWLTLDFKNNRLFQKEVSAENNPVIESEFNAYCKARQAVVDIV